MLACMGQLAHAGMGQLDIMLKHQKLVGGPLALLCSPPLLSQAAFNQFWNAFQDIHLCIHLGQRLFCHALCSRWPGPLAYSLYSGMKSLYSAVNTHNS